MGPSKHLGDTCSLARPVTCLARAAASRGLCSPPPGLEGLCLPRRRHGRSLPAHDAVVGAGAGAGKATAAGRAAGLVGQLPRWCQQKSHSQQRGSSDLNIPQEGTDWGQQLGAATEAKLLPSSVVACAHCMSCACTFPAAADLASFSHGRCEPHWPPGWRHRANHCAVALQVAVLQLVANGAGMHFAAVGGDTYRCPTVQDLPFVQCLSRRGRALVGRIHKSSRVGE